MSSKATTKRRQLLVPRVEAAKHAPLPIISVPSFPRLDEYAGVWAMEQSAFAARVEMVRNLDLAAHVANAGTPRLQSAVDMLPTGRGKSIAQIKVMGTLMKQSSSLEQSTSTVQLRRDIRQAAANPDVSGIMLLIDSPGGTVAGTHDLAKDVKAATKRKPVYAFVDDLGASAAYWIASQADAIYANSETALVGSIGTLATVYDVSGAAEKQGIKAMVFATGPLKGAGIPGASISEEQQAYFQGIVNDAQQSFDAAVKSGRGLTDKQLADVRSGAVFSASDAMNKKLIDGIQSYDATMEALAGAARKHQQETRQREASVEPNDVDTGTVTVNVQADLATLRQQQADEIQRMADVRRICLENGNPSMSADGEGQGALLEAYAIRNGWDATRTELEALRLANSAARLTELRQSRPAPAIISRSHDSDCTLEALQGAIILRAGGRLDHPSFGSTAAYGKVPAWLQAGINDTNRQRAMEFAHRYSDTSMVDICREAVRLDGHAVPHTRGDLLKAAFSGSTLTNIFTTSVNVMLLSSYAEVADTTMGWTKTVDVADFKTNERPRLTKGPNLAKLPRGGTADHATQSDVAESYKIARYARQFVVDEQDMIDDSMNAISGMPREFGLAAARLRPDLVYYILLSNPTLTATSTALFHVTQDQATNAGNLDSSSALAASTLKAGISAMMLFTENSVNLNITPTHLIVPPTLSWTAAELMQSTQIVIARGGTTDLSLERGNANVLANLLQIVSDPRLENGVVDPITGSTGSGSASTWFMAAAAAHTIEVAYLRGTGRTPQVRSFSLEAGQWGIGWDVNLDIGAKAMDWHGLYKATA